MLHMLSVIVDLNTKLHLQILNLDSHQYINDQGQYVAPMSNNHQPYTSFMENENNGTGMYYEQQHQVSFVQLKV